MNGICLSSTMSDQSQEDSGPFSPVISKKGFGIGSIVWRAASVAAKQAYAAACSSSSNFDDELIPLKCSLMSVSLPWEHIAYDLLFKVRRFVDYLLLNDMRLYIRILFASLHLV